ncbi:MAG: hypothetical protein ACJ77A_13335 [Actinomycetota bacterium]
MTSPGEGEGRPADRPPGQPLSVDLPLPSRESEDEPANEPAKEPAGEPAGEPVQERAAQRPTQALSAQGAAPTERLSTATAAPGGPPATRSVERRGRPLALANLALGRSELAFVVMLAIGEALAFGQDLIGGIAHSNVTVARIGGLYVFGSLRVPIQVRASGSGIRGTFLDLSVALLTVTAIGVVLLFRGGQAVGDRAGGGVARRAVWGSAVGLPFGLLTFLLSLLVGFHFRIPVIEGGQVAIGVSRPWAAFLPLGAGIVVGLLGGAWSGLSGIRAGGAGRGATPPRAGAVLVAGAFAGAWRMFAWALGLSFVGLLVLAGLNPDATRAYVDRTAGGGASGVDLLVHHTLALPNQSMLVLVPAMGGCDRVEGTAPPRSFLCFTRFPEHGDVNLGAPFVHGKRVPGRSPFAGVRFGNAPSAFLLFLLVPLAAAVLGGIRAGKPTESRGHAASAGLLAGVGFALLVVAGCVAAGLTVRFYGGASPASITVWPDPRGGGLLALAWGIAGGGIGGFLGWRGPARPRPGATLEPAR